MKSRHAFITELIHNEMIDQDDVRRIDENYLIFPLSFERILRVICNQFYASIEELDKYEVQNIIDDNLDKLKT